MMNVTQARRARATTAVAWGRSLVAGACLGLLAATGAMAAPTSFPDRTTTVMLDGEAVQGHRSKLENTVVFDNGTYYLWYRADNTGLLNSLKLATSSDGVNFKTQGQFKPTGTDPWWSQLDDKINYPITREPLMSYLRLQKVGDNWIMAIWNSANTAASEYQYNTTLWDLGNSPGNLDATQIGPLNRGSGANRPGGPGGGHVGTFGIIRDAEGVDTIYLRADSSPAATEPSYPGSGLGRYQLGGADKVLTTPPLTQPSGTLDDVTGSMFAGTGFCKSAVAASCGVGDVPGWVDNTGRVLAEGDTLHLYYSLDASATGRPGAQQLFYLKSDKNGLAGSWSDPAPLFTDGSQVKVDGLTNTGNFSRPEVVPLGGGEYRRYFSIYDACGREVIVTDEVPAATPTMGITKAFDPSEVLVDGESKLTVTVTAPEVPCGDPKEAVSYTNISYTDKLPDGVVVDSAADGDNLCGGTLTAVSGATSFTVSGFTLAAGANCTTTLKVKPTQAGVFENIIHKSPEAGDGGLSNDQGVPAAEDATATLTATAPTPLPTLIVTKVLSPTDDSGKFTLHINGAPSASSFDVGHGGTTGEVEMVAGWQVSVAEIAGTGTDLGDYDSKLSCTGVEGVTGTTSGSFTMPETGAVSCTFTNTRKGTPAPVTVAPIPTLGQVSLGLLGLLMAGWGARSLRRRQG